MAQGCEISENIRVPQGQRSQKLGPSEGQNITCDLCALQVEHLKVLDPFKDLDVTGELGRCQNYLKVT